MQKKVLLAFFVVGTLALGAWGNDSYAFKLKDLKKKVGIDSSSSSASSPAPAGAPAANKPSIGGGTQETVKKCPGDLGRDETYTKDLFKKKLDPIAKKAAQTNNCEKAVAVMSKELGIPMRAIKKKANGKRGSLGEKAICSCNANAYTVGVTCDENHGGGLRKGKSRGSYLNSKLTVSYRRRYGECYGTTDHEEWLIDPRTY